MPHYEARNASRARVLTLSHHEVPSSTPFILTIGCLDAGTQMLAHLSADDLLELEALLISARQRGALPVRAAA